MTSSVTVAAEPLSAEELAACIRSGVAFTDIVVMWGRPDDRFTPVLEAVSELLARGYEAVLYLDPESVTMTIHPARSHLRFYRPTEEFASPELPNVTCRVNRFFQLLRAG